MCERRQNQTSSRRRCKTWLWSCFVVYLVIALAAPTLTSAASTSPNSAPVGTHAESTRQTPEEEADAVREDLAADAARSVFGVSSVRHR